MKPKFARNRLFLSAIVFTGLTVSASAAPITWDGDTSTDFATGDNWAGGSAPTNDIITDIGVFTGTPTANQPVLGANRSIFGIDFQSGGWTLSGSIFTLGTGGIKSTGANTVSSGLVIDTANTSFNIVDSQLNFTGTMTGTGSIIKTGNGILNVTTGNKAFSGDLTISAGTVRTAVDWELNNVDIASGATLELAYDNRFGKNRTTFTGSGSLIKTSSGATNFDRGTFALGSGSIIDVQAGTFTAGSGGNEIWTNNLSDLQVATGARFNGSESDVRVDALTGTGQITASFNNFTSSGITFGVDGGSGTFSGELADNGTNHGHYTKEGAGNQTISGPNTFSGNMTINGGTLTLGSASALGGSAAAVGVSQTAAGTQLITPSDTLRVGQYLSGTGFADGTYISARVSATEVTLSQATTQIVTAATVTGSTSIGNNGTLDLNGQTIFEYFRQIDGVFTNSNTSTGAEITTEMIDLGNPDFDGPGDITVSNIRRSNSSGTRRITKYGTGTLTLAGNQSNNRYGLTVNNGDVILAKSAGEAISRFALIMNNASSTVTLQGKGDQIVDSTDQLHQINAGTLDLNGFNEQISALGTSNGTEPGGIVTNSNGGTTSILTLSGAGDTPEAKFPGAVTGNLALVKDGINTQTLTGTNTFTGGTTVSRGTLVLGTGGSMIATNSLVMGSGGNSGTFQLGDATSAVNTTVTSLTKSGTGTTNAVIGGHASNNSVLTVNINADTTYDGFLGSGIVEASAANNLSLIKTGTGQFMLKGVNTYTGGTVLQDGNLIYDDNSALGSGILTINGGRLTGKSTGLVLANDITVGGNFAFGAESDGISSSAPMTLSGTIDLGNETREITVRRTTEISGVISSGGLTYKGVDQDDVASLDRTLTLTGANTYEGTTTVESGILKLQGAAFSTTVRDYSISSGATLNLDGDHDPAAGGTSTISGAGTLLLTGGKLSRDSNNGAKIDMELGSGALIDIKSGATLQNGGWSAFDWTNNLADMNVDGTLDIWDGNEVRVDALTGDGLVTTTITGSSTQVLTVGVDGGSGDFGGTITKTNDRIFNFVKDGAGTQILSGNTTFSDINFSVNSGGTLEFNAAAGDQQIDGGEFTGNGTFVKSGSGTLKLGANGSEQFISMTGGLIDVQEGTLRNEYSNGNWDGNLASLNVESGATVDLWDSPGGITVDALTGGGTVQHTSYGNASNLTVGINNGGGTFSGTISDESGHELNLVKAGSGTQTLTGTNTYTGTTTISGGKLVINGDQTGATGTVTVESGATLGGNGTLGGNLVVDGTHAVGNSPDLQTVVGDATYNSTSIFEWELSSNTTSGRGTNFDAVNVGGDLAIDDSATFKVILGTAFNGLDAFWQSTQSWDVFSVTGSKTGVFETFAIYNASNLTSEVNYSSYGSFNFGYAGNNGTLTWSAVPEPTSALAGLLLGCGLLRRRRQS